MQACKSFEEDQKLILFLMGLNERYMVVRGNILMLKPLPTVSQAYAILVQEEKQREVSSGNQFNLEAVSMNVGNTYNVGRGSQRTKNFGRGGPSIFCDSYKKVGHTKEKCYKLHGFSDRESRQKSFACQAQTNNASLSLQQCQNNDNISGVHVPELTMDQYIRLMDLLSKNATSNDPNLNTDSAGAANFAGKVSELIHNVVNSCAYSNSCKQPCDSPTLWIIDSGASNHMCHDAKMFLTLANFVKPFLITLPNEKAISVAQFGDVKVADNLTLKNVLHVPSFHYNLLSIAKLTKQMHCKIMFIIDHCIL
ncbi:hypothetical protein IHE45_10G039400 [Dioscorea alata]|uniref:Uncharacterized protein n=1 Tax=Dioscorea alata TaxID=55571 RepID=A0ACB7VAR2_DIOAL|nr:hypothetical protein IHE45_10G039400 [Dioscorea alata]